jgi:hypothetical protein
MSVTEADQLKSRWSSGLPADGSKRPEVYFRRPFRNRLLWLVE